MYIFAHLIYVRESKRVMKIVFRNEDARYRCVIRYCCIPNKHFIIFGHDLTHFVDVVFMYSDGGRDRFKCNNSVSRKLAGRVCFVVVTNTMH